MIYILDKQSDKLIEVEIQLVKDIKTLPLKKNGWNFNWRSLSKVKNSQTFVIRRKESPQEIEGILLLRTEGEMLIMDVIEIAPDNVGSKNKKYDYVAGCLIAFACRESFKIEGNYRGFLSFTSKTDLIGWYIDKYGAERALRQYMFISPQKGEELVEEYLNRVNK